MTEYGDKGPVTYVPSMGACINRRFTKYEDARKALKTEGGCLFPFKNQFLVTESERFGASRSTVTFDILRKIINLVPPPS